MAGISLRQKWYFCLTLPLPPHLESQGQLRVMGIQPPAGITSLALVLSP